MILIPQNGAHYTRDRAKRHTSHTFTFRTVDPLPPLPPPKLTLSPSSSHLTVMADSACRKLRDGVLEGELAPVLLISDANSNSFAGPSIFNFFLRSLASNITSSRSQAKGLVVVAFNRTPEFYMKLLTSAGVDGGLHSWFQVLDCFTDPLGWKKKIVDNLKPYNLETSEKHQEQESHAGFTVYRDIGNMDGLMSAIISSGEGLNGNQCNARFSVAIDLVSIMMRHLPLPSVASLINNLRCHAQISCVLLLIHSEVHNLSTSMALEYMSSMVAFIEPITPLSRDLSGLKSHPHNLAALEENLKRGRFRLRVKRRNGRVQEQIEEFKLERANVKFSPTTHGNLIVKGSSNIPQVRFNLQLTEKERQDRAKVTLPFEHQGNGKEIHIYDGRKGSIEWKASPVLDSEEATRNSVIASSVASKEGGKGEIHYVRDSDDERPDSDEDPDDDLDI